jgi:Flp pilus assembly protein TadD
MKTRRICFGIGLVLVSVFIAWKWWPRTLEATSKLTTIAPSDPRLTYSTPFLNVRPEVKYVGDESCARCHRDQANSYHQHPMGRSLAPVQSATPIERYDAQAKNPFVGLGFTYAIQRRSEKVFHRETAADAKGQVVCEAEAEAAFAVGSGVRGRGYIINRDGYLFESPITWYTQKAAWDLSPGYDRVPHHFGRPVVTDCLFCHANHVREVAGTENRYESPIFEGYAIGCERCHGPGELHARRQEKREAYEGVDFTIVNPVHLEPVTREAICEQCHLEGMARVLKRGRQAFDFRPGLPLHLFLAVFVSPGGRGAEGEGAKSAEKFVGQVEQLHASRCFRASNGRMGCTTCHDPHAYPTASERVAFYRERCQHCHKDPSCALPLEVRKKTSKDDNCVQCHMPGGPSDIAHHSITNHRIPRLANEAGPDSRQADDDLFMRFFHRDLAEVGDAEVERDTGIALMERVERYDWPTRRAVGTLALGRLESALRADPSDVPALDAKAHALWAIGDFENAAKTFDAVLELMPGREASLRWAAILALEQKRSDDAIGYLERAIAVNPWRHEFHYYLAYAHVRGRSWTNALKECQEALRLNPADFRSRQLLVEAHLGLAHLEQAQAEFDRLLALHPPGEEALRQWFSGLMGANPR